MFSFTGTIANWITDDWKLVERVIDFHPIQEKEHEGVYAAVAFAKTTSQVGILKKICCHFIHVLCFTKLIMF